MARENRTECAARVMETIPLVMRSIGAEMRRRHASEISAQQFHAMMFVRRNPGATLSRTSDFMGLTMSSASKLMDTLVDKRLVSRKTDARDRRRIVLALTKKGESALDGMQNDAMAYLAEKLSPLSAPEIAEVLRAMGTLRRGFAVAPAEKFTG